MVSVWNVVKGKANQNRMSEQTNEANTDQEDDQLETPREADPFLPMGKRATCVS